ncbi:MAG: M61 family metallopeptidase [Actinomycetes bacterium]
MSEPVRHLVDLALRAHHLVRVDTTVPADVAAGARVVFPTWTPGSYVVRDYVHHVQRIDAVDVDGEPVELTPDGTTAWRLPADVAGPVTVRVELYANELTVRTNHVDDRHALLVAPATFPYVEGAEGRPHHVTFAPAADDADPAVGTVHALLPEADEPHTFVADDLDHLVDSAFEVGDHATVSWELDGVPHRFVHAAPGPAPDLDRVAADARAIGEAAVALFDGDLPVERYTFLHVGADAATGGGGLEHRDGSVLMMPVLTWTEPDAYARFQSLVAHEYLHLWNVKRLVPADLLDLDYVHPAPTTSLWVAEGWTAYYDELLPTRAGLWTLRRHLDALRDGWRAVLDTPGTANQSLWDSSRHAWTGLYVRDENSVNKGTNYYGHGAVVAWCLDLAIRRAVPDGDGLDDALRLLWRRFGGTGRGYTERDVAEALDEAAGGAPVSDLVTAHVAGRELPDLPGLVDVVGLRLTDVEPNGAPAPPGLGVQTSEDDHGITLTAVLRDRAAWRAGLTGGDRLLAVDGMRVGRGELAATLRRHAPGDTVDVTVFSGPRLRTVAVTLDPPAPAQRFVAVDEPSDAQREAFRRWTGRPLAEL